MKRAQFIEWGIIAVALIFGYQFIQSVLLALTQIIYSFDVDGLSEIIIRWLLAIVVYFVVFLILIKNSAKLGAYFGAANTTEEIPLSVKIGKRSMLQVILIAACVFTILTNIADIIFYLFDVFKSEVRKNDGLLDPGRSKVDKTSLIISIVQTVLAIIVIYFSRNISSFLIPKNEADELVFDSTTETDKP